MEDKVRQLNTQEEARQLLNLQQGPGSFDHAIAILRAQFGVIQSRYQFLTTLGALTLTITGFSGPRIAASNSFSRYSMIVGLIFVLVAMLLLLVSSLKLRWVTQIGGSDPEKTVESILRYRDSKSALFGVKLTLLAIGLTFYVAAVIAYFLIGDHVMKS